MMDFIFEKIFFPIMFIFIILIFLAIPFAIYDWYKEAKRETFHLKKDDWSCSKEYKYTTSTMILVGKVIIPQTITHQDCIQWSHK